VKKTISIDNYIFYYEFERKKIRNINMRIRPDGSIYVSSPMKVSDKAVEKFMISKKDFIIKSLNKVNDRLANNFRPVIFEDGTRVKVFGEIKTIEIRKASRNSVLVEGDRVIIDSRNPEDQDSVARVYNKWRGMMLRAKVEEISCEVCPKFVAMGAKAPTAIKFRTMKSRWGSCKPRERVLTFNYNLFETPEECVRYVVVHEYAHLLVADHSARFYRYVERIMPDWREQRRRLNEY